MKRFPKIFTRAVAGLSASQMRRGPARGKWSIIEILGHLHDTEVVYGYRYRFSLCQPGSLNHLDPICAIRKKCGW